MDGKGEAGLASLPFTQVRRSKYVFIHFEDGSFFDIECLLAGEVKLTALKQILVTSCLTEQKLTIGKAQFDLLSLMSPGSWTSVEHLASTHQVDEPHLLTLARAGVVLTDSEQEGLARLRELEATIERTQWNKYALFYHTSAKWRDVSVTIPGDGNTEELARLLEERDARYELFVERSGKPPAHFHEIEHAITRTELPLPDRDSELYRVLRERKTVREFDDSRPMSADDLATILYSVWGCHGYLPLHEDVVGVKKTSPSGGDLHAIEVYPLLINVDGFNPGLYHYNVESHRLDLFEQMQQEDAADAALKFVAGQTYFARAHALFIMTARFYRNYWKYRGHPRAYSVILMDAAHLSQTHYLVSTELELGPFVTAAINGANIEERLGLDGISEGAIAICGCGIPRATVSLEADVLDLSPEYLPYIPRQTKVETWKPQPAKPHGGTPS